MGADPYEYIVHYEQDFQAALDKLRARVFEKGDYRGVDLGPSTLEQAVEMAGAEGTGSILDILRISSEPEMCCAAPLTAEEMEEYFGTIRPELEMVRQSEEFWETIDRGMARCVPIFEAGRPTKIFFAGYSFD